jgi:hypothetical protein
MRTPEERNRKMRLLESLGALSSLAAAVLIFAALDSASAQPLLIFAADLCIVAFIFQLVTFVIGRGLQKRVEKGRDEQAHGLASAEAPQLAPADPEQFLARPPSVTERTTELLEPGRVRRGGDRAEGR